MSREVHFFIDDIIDSCHKIISYTDGMSFKDFTKNDLTYDAVVRNLEIIGEAAKNIPDNIRNEIPSVEWRKVCGLRDIIIHAYFGIDNEILWDVISNKLPTLLNDLESFQQSTQ